MPGSSTKIKSKIYVLYDVFGNWLRASPNPINKRYPNQEVKVYVPLPDTCRTCANRGKLCGVPYCKHWGHPIPDYNGTQFCSFHAMREEQ